MRTLRRLAIFVVLALTLSSCAPIDDAQQEVVSTTSQHELTTIRKDSPETLDPNRFGDFPSEPTDDWLIGTDYERVSFVDVATGKELGAAEVTLSFYGRYSFGASAAGCGSGGGEFVWDGGRISNRQANSLDLVACEPTDIDVYQAFEALLAAEPEIRVGGNRLLILSKEYRLELEATGPGVIPTIETGERFIAAESTVPNIEPGRIELTAPAFFVLVATLPTCALHGGPSEDQESFGFPTSPINDPCEFSPAEDKAAQAFLTEGGVLSRNENTLELSNSQGAVQFRLATQDDLPTKPQPVPPPELVIPDPPIRVLPAEEGRLSEPWYAERAGDTDSGGADIPIPEEWTAADRSIPSARVVGRGTMGVSFRSGNSSWSPDNREDGLKVVDGPTEVTIKLYRREGDQIVETGAVITAQQYRFGSDDSNEWRRDVVRVFELNGQIVVASVGFPEFPDDSGFGTDPRNQSLAGLDPIDLLDDFRFFE